MFGKNLEIMYRSTHMAPFSCRHYLVSFVEGRDLLNSSEIVVLSMPVSPSLNTLKNKEDEK